MVSYPNYTDHGLASRMLMTSHYCTFFRHLMTAAFLELAEKEKKNIDIFSLTNLHEGNMRGLI